MPLLHDEWKHAVKIAREAVAEFVGLYNYNWLSGMRAKLGIFNEEPGDRSLWKNFLILCTNIVPIIPILFFALTFDKFEDTAFLNLKNFHNGINYGKPD